MHGCSLCNCSFALLVDVNMYSLLLTMLNERRAGGEDVNECLEWWRAEVSVGPERQR